MPLTCIKEDLFIKAYKRAIVEFFRIDHGNIPCCQPAALVLLDWNPLENIANARKISGILAGNTWYDRHKLDQLLEEARIPGN